MRFLPNGQWTLEKSAEAPIPELPRTNLRSLIGKTHTVEVHPDIDHLYRLKNHIQSQPKQNMSLSNIKRSEFGFLARKIPRDANGRVTPEMLDKHIAALPKHKVQVKVVPYEIGMQQHREGVPQYAVSVGLHPDTLKGMSEKEQYAWNHLKNQQHDLKGHEHQIGWARIDPHKIVANSEPDGEGGTTINHAVAPNPGHWHIDEIQSDFGAPDKLKDKMDANVHRIFANIYDQVRDPDNFDKKSFLSKYPELSEHLDTHFANVQNRDNALKPIFQQQRELSEIEEQTPEVREKLQQLLGAHQSLYDQFNEQNKPFTDALEKVSQRVAAEHSKKIAQSGKIAQILAHGHQDPMHMIHSAINQLGRQNGVTSTSMDLPNHQAHQSGLRASNQPVQGNGWDQFDAYINGGNVTDEKKDALWEQHGGQDLINDHIGDIDFKSAADKLGPEGLKNWANLALTDLSSWSQNGGDRGNVEWNETLQDPDFNVFSQDMKDKLLGMSPSERDALSRFLGAYGLPAHNQIMREQGFDGWEVSAPLTPDTAQYDDLPVHQVNTYDKRPKKLGFTPVDKKDVMGEYPRDGYNRVQYAKLHKKLREIQELLRKI